MIKKEVNQFVIYIYKGIRFYTDTIPMDVKDAIDYVYIKVIGKTKAEYTSEQEQIRQKFLIEKKLKEQEM